MSGHSTATSSSPEAGPSTLSVRRKAVLNVPEGNQKISEEKEFDPADVRTGDVKQDVLEAIKRINPAEDLRNIGKVPCARQALLTGIAGGTGFGAVVFLSRRRTWTAANWAVGTFVGISALMWENCRRKRVKELSQMAIIQEKFAHRHISQLKRKETASAPVSIETQNISSDKRL